MVFPVTIDCVCIRGRSFNNIKWVRTKLIHDDLAFIKWDRGFEKQIWNTWALKKIWRWGNKYRNTSDGNKLLLFACYKLTKCVLLWLLCHILLISNYSFLIIKIRGYTTQSCVYHAYSTGPCSTSFYTRFLLSVDAAHFACHIGSCRT